MRCWAQDGRESCAGKGLSQPPPARHPPAHSPSPANSQTKWRRLGCPRGALKGAAARWAWWLVEKAIARRRKEEGRKRSALSAGAFTLGRPEAALPATAPVGSGVTMSTQVIKSVVEGNRLRRELGYPAASFAVPRGLTAG